MHDRDSRIGPLLQDLFADRAEGFLRAWSHEDVYFTLDAELEMMRAAGFATDVVWRRDCFAVILGA